MEQGFLSHIGNLPATGLQILGLEECLNLLEELLDNFRLAQSLSKEGDCGDI